MSKKPCLTINPLFEDGFSATSPADYYAFANLSGTARNVESGNYVQVTLNGQTYQGLVDKNGEWRIPLSPSTITNLINVDPSVTHDLVVSVTNNQGYATEQIRKVSVVDMLDGRAAGIAISPIAGNDELIGREKMHGQVISGLTERVAEGEMVTITLEGKSWQVPVDANGAWSSVLTPEMMKDLTPGEHTLTVSAPSIYGDSYSSDERTFTVTNEKGTSYAAEINVNSITGDDLLTAIEQQSSLIVSGTTANVASGKEVWVQLGDDIYAATVKNNHWQAEIPASDLAELNNGPATLIAWVKDLRETATTVREFTVGESLTMPYITLDVPYNNFDADDIQWALLTEVLSGHVTNVAAGSYLNITFGDLRYQARIDENGDWRLPVAPDDLLSQPTGEIPLVLSITNAQGETAELSKTIYFSGIDTGSETRVVINPVSGDDIINAREKQTELTITGDSLNVPAGQLVELRFPDALGNNAFFGIVDQTGEWRVSLSADDLKNLPAGALRIEVTVPGSTLNGGPLTGEHWVTIEPGNATENVASLTIDSLEDYSRLTLDQLSGLVVSGSATNISDGSEVWLQLGDWAWTGEVHQGQWQVTIPADKVPELRTGGVIFEATVRNNANGDSADDTVYINLDPAVPPDGPYVRLDAVWGDDVIIRTDDIRPDYLITGTFTGNDWSDINLTLNGKSYSAQVTNGSWMVWIPDQDIRALPDGEVPIKVQWGELSDTSTLTLNTDTDVPLFGATLDTVDGQNLITSFEVYDKGLTLSGGVLDASVAPLGTRVNIEFHSKHYQTTLTGDDTNPRWSLTIPAEDMQALDSYDAQIVRVTLGEAGQHNVVTARNLEFTEDEGSRAYTPQMLINPLGDDIIDQSEVDSVQVLSGTSLYFWTGQQVVVTLDNLRWETTTDSSGHWKVAIPAGELAGIADGEHRLEAGIYFNDPDSGEWAIANETSLTFNTGTSDAMLSAKTLTLADLGLDQGLVEDASHRESTSLPDDALTSAGFVLPAATGDLWAIAERAELDTTSYLIPPTAPQTDPLIHHPV
ncbi:hypothetical protein [Pantoea sp. FN0307]|uniref:hypothetical protein n=1 Tax=Pantoea sp. FN0307 TaxID=3418560 RepID=UPI003CF59E2E